MACVANCGCGKKKQSSSDEVKREKKLPINKIGFLSYIFLTWMTPLVIKLFRRRTKPIDVNDLWQCSNEEGVKSNTDRLFRIWQDELEKRGRGNISFERVWRQFIQRRMLLSLLIMLLWTGASLLSMAFLLRLVVEYLESSTASLGYGLSLTVAVLAAQITKTLAFANIWIFGAQTGIRFLAGFMGLAYKKLFRLRTMTGKANVEIINIFSMDSHRMFMASLSITFIFSVPIFVVGGSVYCHYLIGPWCFVAIGVWIITYLVMILLSRVLQQLRTYSIVHTDKRIRKMGELLNNITFIKMHAWEQPMFDAIIDARKSEQRYLQYSAIVNCIFGSLVPVHNIASVITFTIYTVTGNSLSAATAFAFVGTMEYLRSVMAFLPASLRAYGEAKVSFRRIEKLLLQDEFTPPLAHCTNTDNAIEIEEADFTWRTENIETNILPTNVSEDSLNVSTYETKICSMLTGINLQVKRGRLLGICGPVGSGKSSLVSAILGQMPKIVGKVAIDGSVAYVPQQAWIFNASLKDNIIFGTEYHSERYKKVITACCLDKDFRLLPNGDETEIGEQGVNLSGGQKQRVNLARAVYSDNSLYLLDDPLSAVDLQLREHIFHNCILSLLNTKTVVFVTHQLYYMKFCDEVVLMEVGRIDDHGTHSELLANSGSYSELFRRHDDSSMKPKANNNDNGSVLEDVDQDLSNINENMTPEPRKSFMCNGILNSEDKKGKLVSTEQAAIGNISLSTYRSYVNAAGGLPVVFLVMFLYFLVSGSLVFSDWWLSEWIITLSAVVKGNHTQNLPTNLTGVSRSSMSHPTDGSFTTGMSWDNVTVSGTSHTSSQSEGLGGIAPNTFSIVFALSLPAIMCLQIALGCISAKVLIAASSGVHAKALSMVLRAPTSFFSSNPSGRILNRFSRDLDEGDVYVPSMIYAVLQMLSFVILTAVLPVILTPWIIIPIVPVVICFYIMKRISIVCIRQLKRLENISRSPLLAFVNSTTHGLSTIVAYGHHERFFNIFAALGDMVVVSKFISKMSRRWIALYLDLLAGILLATTTLILVLTKGILPAEYGGLIFVVCGTAGSFLQYLIGAMSDLEAKFTSIERLHEYEEKIVTETKSADKIAPPKWPREGSVLFKDVVIRYRHDIDPALQNISFEVLPREKVGIIGRTGAGKSSIVAALFRLLELSSGHIFIDGEDISQLPLEIIRSKMSIIPQEPVLFTGTLRYTVDPFVHYSDDQIWDALEKVHMKNKILAIEGGLSTEIKENGGNFSVGERQLICLSRAILRSSKILVLDEATANIDTVTDSMIQETLRDCFSDCTIITIAHRLSTVLHSDKIIVMDAGKVVEYGTPQDLKSDPESFFTAGIASQNSQKT